jgi:adenylosuccinate synthase
VLDLVHSQLNFFDADGEALRAIGGEVGVTTGRNRRCGWFDAPIARYAVRVNGLTDFFLTKLDVLSTWEKIPVCVAYEIDGVRVEELPASQSISIMRKPIYEYLPGWMCDISNARSLMTLPANARAYVKFLEDLWRSNVGDMALAEAAIRRSRIASSFEGSADWFWRA